MLFQLYYIRPNPISLFSPYPLPFGTELQGIGKSGVVYIRNKNIYILMCDQRCGCIFILYLACCSGVMIYCNCNFYMYSSCCGCMYIPVNFLPKCPLIYVYLVGLPILTLPMNVFGSFTECLFSEFIESISGTFSIL